MKHHLVVAAVAVAAAVGYLWTGGSDPLAPIASPAAIEGVVARVGSDAFAHWLPALREGVPVTFSSNASGDPADPAQAVASIATLGPLVGSDLDSLVVRMQRRAEKRYADLKQVAPDAQARVSFGLLEQAEILCEAEESLAAADALRRGQYFVTTPGTRPPGPPNAGLVQTGAMQAGKRVTVSIVMPFAEYPKFADAYAYRREMHLLYPASAVDFWNGQDEAWRRQAAARVAATSQSSGSEADRAWRRQYAPNGTVVDPDSLLLALRQ